MTKKIKQKSTLYCMLLLWSMAFLCTACQSKNELSNVVATVNGKPIYLHTVLLVQESGVSQFDSSRPPTLTRIRNQYGSVLAELIVYEIIAQHLENIGLGITTRQLADYEKTFRENFSDNEFNTFFLENAIDVNAWRELLYYHLAFQRFTKEVLHKNFVPPLEQVQEYYDNNLQSFHISPRLSMYLVTSTQRGALQNIKTLKDVKALLHTDTDVSILEANIQTDVIKSEWSKAWQKRFFSLKENMCTDIVAEDSVFKKACLESKTPENRISLGQAYPYIELFLKEKNNWPLLESWLAKELENIQIRISTHLIGEIS